MANNAKKYILTAITLGAIAAASAGLIGLTNLLTRDKIKKNELDKFNAGITALFGEKASVNMEYKNGGGGQYIQEWYWVHMSDGSESQYVFKTSGSNSYGKITLLVGFDDGKAFVGTYTITNEQTYATTLNDNYLSVINSKEGSDWQDVDVKCGATYGAKLVRAMVEEAQEWCNGIIID